MEWRYFEKATGCSPILMPMLHQKFILWPSDRGIKDPAYWKRKRQPQQWFVLNVLSTRKEHRFKHKDSWLCSTIPVFASPCVLWAEHCPENLHHCFMLYKLILMNAVAYDCINYSFWLGFFALNRKWCSSAYLLDAVCDPGWPVNSCKVLYLILCHFCWCKLLRRAAWEHVS